MHSVGFACLLLLYTCIYLLLTYYPLLTNSTCPPSPHPSLPPLPSSSLQLLPRTRQRRCCFIIFNLNCRIIFTKGYEIIVPQPKLRSSQHTGQKASNFLTPLRWCAAGAFIPTAAAASGIRRHVSRADVSDVDGGSRSAEDPEKETQAATNGMRGKKVAFDGTVVWEDICMCMREER